MVRDGLVCTNGVGLDTVIWNVREERLVQVVKEFDRDLTAVFKRFDSLLDSLLVVENFLGIFCFRLTRGGCSSRAIYRCIEVRVSRL
jgi:hypothetical protein